MNAAEQIKFVEELSSAVVRDICGKIASGKTPEAWDGHELRCLLAEAFEQEADHTLIRREKRSSRTRDYKMSVMVGNLA